MKIKISRKLRAYASLIVFVILAVSFILTGLFLTVLFLLGKLRFIFASPILGVAWIYLVSLVSGTMITAFLGRLLLSPLAKISGAFSEVAKGNFSVRLDETSRIDEIYTTSHNFNVMVQELGTIETLRSDFIANVSHEFKTPLTAIEGYATLLQEPDITEDNRREYTERIIYNTSRLTTLTGNILLLSKIENQNIPTSVQEYSLDEQLRQTLLLLEKKWNDKNIELDIELDEVNIVSCESLLLHVWLNLFSNAIKYSPQNGSVSVTLTKDDKTAKVTVKDEGPGMDAATIAHIFEKFYQGDNSHRAEGNGLGLALVQRILDLCRGKISVVSEQGKGSEFIVSLPLK